MRIADRTILHWLIPALALAGVLAAGTVVAEEPGKSYEMYKSPTCGCCVKWAEHLAANDMHGNIHHLRDLNAVKVKLGIEPKYQSCHTAVFDGDYFFEGHVPARYIERFLVEKPEGALGLAVPGMPLGSPGMEVEDRFTPYQVLMIMEDGSRQVYADISSPEQQ